MLTVSDWLWTEPGELEFLGLFGGDSVPSKQVELLAFGGTSGTFVAEPKAPWITVNPSSGDIPDTIDVGVDLTTLPNGEFRDSVVFTSPEIPGSRAVLYCDLRVSSWTAQELSGLGIHSNFEGISAVDASTAWIAGWFPAPQDKRGFVFRTTNGGDLWEEVLEQFSTRFGDVAFIDNQKGWVVGDSSIMLRTIDGGDNWTEVTNLPSGSTVNLRRIDFGDRSHGWVAGSDGVILQTSDSGETWEMATTPTDFDLTEIVSINDQQVWVSGNHGVILHSDNGGAVWTLQNTGTSSDLRSVHFVDENTGWTVGIDGILLYTSDGGTTWVEKDSGTDKLLLDVWFATPERGWVVGLDGLIYRSSDGGDTWVRQITGSTEGFFEVVFVDEETGWVVGQSGTVLKTASGGF
jgi:photosystem II stability/assembly factor-like uncharacterized protein